MPLAGGFDAFTKLLALFSKQLNMLAKLLVLQL